MLSPRSRRNMQAAKWRQAEEQVITLQSSGVRNPRPPSRTTAAPQHLQSPEILVSDSESEEETAMVGAVNHKSTTELINALKAQKRRRTTKATRASSPTSPRSLNTHAHKASLSYNLGDYVKSQATTRAEPTGRNTPDYDSTNRRHTAPVRTVCAIAALTSCIMRVNSLWVCA